MVVLAAPYAGVWVPPQWGSGRPAPGSVVDELIAERRIEATRERTETAGSQAQWTRAVSTSTYTQLNDLLLNGPRTG